MINIFLIQTEFWTTLSISQCMSVGGMFYFFNDTPVVWINLAIYVIVLCIRVFTKMPILEF